MSVYVGDRSVQRFRRAPSGENASKGDLRFGQPILFIFVSITLPFPPLVPVKAAEICEKWRD